jgi:hypothetical protein
MSYNLVINSSNVVNSLNNQYRYDFINGSFEIPENAEIMISSLQIPYSWYNISTRYNNRNFNIYWPTSTVQTITLTDGGSGYQTAPSVQIIGANTTQATANCTITGTLVSIPITAGGTGYIAAPTVDINGGGATTNASATAILTAGVVTNIIINNPGIGYTSPPTVTFTPVNGGTGATAGTAVINGVVNSLTLTSPGSGYGSVYPTVQFTGTNTTPAKAEVTIYKKYHVVLPEGFYTTTSLNAYLQNFSIENGLYLIENSTQNYIYYISVVYNVTYYANQVVLKTVPTSLPAGFTAPANWAGYVASARTPYVEILSDNDFGKFLGFKAGNIGFNKTSNYSENSPIAPLGSNVNSLVIKCNLVNNNVSSQTDIVDSFAINGTFGSNLNFNNNIEKWIRLNAGRYYSFIVSIVDEKMRDIQILDNNILINFIIRTRK